MIPSPHDDLALLAHLLHQVATEAIAWALVGGAHIAAGQGDHELHGFAIAGAGGAVKLTQLELPGGYQTLQFLGLEDHDVPVPHVNQPLALQGTQRAISALAAGADEAGQRMPSSVDVPCRLAR